MSVYHLKESRCSKSITLDDLEKNTSEAELRWANRMQIDPSLTRSLVSFQANKSKAIYRWFKYKEAFSADLVNSLLKRYQITKGLVLDPFAGSGTALFVAGGLGIKAEGIELLPIGQSIIKTRKVVEWDVDDEVVERLRLWCETLPWHSSKTADPIIELRITRGAYSEETIEAIGRFLNESRQEEDRVGAVLQFALLCILESISYTRKDGQYLRWDYRAGRRQGKTRFDKGAILSFDVAMKQKLREIITDLRSAELPESLFPIVKHKADVRLYEDSCLNILPNLHSESYDCIITSPPYCNRYDYTRTYALELAMLGVGEKQLLKLRQTMLSCTVENRVKDMLALNQEWERAILVADEHSLLQNILAYLNAQNENGLLNNKGIPRMVRGYFYEMACVISDAARLLKKGAPLIMVNDNVRYAGASIPVDIILSDIAEHLGFRAEKILVLPNGKGNSSQQMGTHGRQPLRKCVYIWRKE